MLCFFFVEYLPEDSRQKLKYVGRLLCGCIPLYLNVVHLL